MVLTFSSCSFSSNNKRTNENSVQTVKVQVPVKPLKQEQVKIPTVKDTVDTLCSDEFEGRSAGSKGNIKTEEYIEEVFKNLGLATLFEDSYYQKYYQGVRVGNDDKLKMVNNVVGVIKGKDSKKAVVISAHFDHIGYREGKLIRGAVDNASGTAALIEIAHNLKVKSEKKPFDMDIILCAFNGEEYGLRGSRVFVNSIMGIYNSLYNINIDCIGAKNGGKLALKNKSKCSNKLYKAIKTTMKKNNIEFGDTTIIGLSDHYSFEESCTPNIFIAQENIRKLIHKPTDTPDIIDYELLKKISNAICDFIETNDGIMFNTI